MTSFANTMTQFDLNAVYPATAVPEMPLLLLIPAQGYTGIEASAIPLGECRVGSDDTCDLRLRFAGISAHHATIHSNTNQIVLIPQDRRTWVNGFPARQQKLKDGDRVSFGPIEFIFRTNAQQRLIARTIAPRDPIGNRIDTPIEQSPRDYSSPRHIQKSAAQLLTDSKTPFSDAVPSHKATSKSFGYDADGDFSELCAELNSEIARLRMEIESQRQALADSMSQRQDVRARQDSLDQNRKELEEQRQSNIKRERELSLLAEDLKQREFELRQAEREASAREDELSAREEDLLNQLAEARQLRDQIASEQQECEQQRRETLRRNDEQTCQRDELNARHAELENALRQLDLDREAFANERDELLKSREELEKQASEIAESRGRLEHERQLLARQQEDFERVRPSLAEESDRLERERTQHEATARELEVQKSQLDEQERDLEAKRQNFAQSVADLEKRSVECGELEQQLLERMRQLELRESQEQRQFTDEVQQRFDNWQTRLEELERELQLSSAELEASQRALLEREVEIAERDANFSQQLESLNAERNQLIEDRQSLADERAKFEREQEEYLSEKKDFEQKQSRLQALALQLEEDRSQIDDFRRQIEEQQSNINQERSRFEARKSELLTLQAEWNARHAGNRELQVNIDAQQAELEQQRLGLDRQRQELDERSQSLERLQEVLDLRQRDIEARQASLDERDRLLDEKSIECNRQSEAIERERTEFERMQSEFEERRLQFDIEQNELAQQQLDRDEREAELRRQIADVEKQQLELVEQREKLRQQEAELESSRAEFEHHQDQLRAAAFVQYGSDQSTTADQSVSTETEATELTNDDLSDQSQEITAAAEHSVDVVTEEDVTHPVEATPALPGGTDATASPDGEDDGSIAEYMEQLLSRSRNSGTTKTEVREDKTTYEERAKGKQKATGLTQDSSPAASPRSTRAQTRSRPVEKRDEPQPANDGSPGKKFSALEMFSHLFNDDGDADHSESTTSAQTGEDLRVTSSALEPAYDTYSMETPDNETGDEWREDDVIVDEEQIPLEEIGPCHSQDKEQTRARLQAFRQMANASADSAINTHATRLIRSRLTIYITTTLLSGGLATALLNSRLWSNQSFESLGWGALGVATVSGIEFLRCTLLKPRRRSRIATHNADDL